MCCVHARVAINVDLGNTRAARRCASACYRRRGSLPAARRFVADVALPLRFRSRRYLLEWMSFAHRYTPAGLLERGRPQRLGERPTPFVGRSDLETWLGSTQAADWIKLSTMLLGPPPEHFAFAPRHKASAVSEGGMAFQSNG